MPTTTGARQEQCSAIEIMGDWIASNPELFELQPAHAITDEPLAPDPPEWTRTCTRNGRGGRGRPSPPAEASRRGPAEEARRPIAQWPVVLGSDLVGATIAMTTRLIVKVADCRMNRE